MAADSSSRMNSETELIAQPGKPSSEGPASASKGLRFWLVFVAICVSLFLSALEYVRILCTCNFQVTDIRLDSCGDDASHHCA